ncbi:MAG TPA: hypothetical protein VFL80_11430, partial [Thermoanaerobaculia bacterium]|nr:hypothetical protein [Thermoanaerobaculia bacterium]
RHQSAGTASAGAIWLGSLDSPERKSIVPASANAVYTSGQLLYVRGGTLLAQPFDSDKLTLTGDPVPVAGPIFEDPDYFRAVFSASESGLLAYRAGGGERRRSLTIHDRTGAVLQRLDEAGLYGKYSLVSFSPDAKRLVIEVSEEKSRNDDLWIVESERGIRTRLTFHSGGDYVPTWSPDGSRIAFSRAEPGKHWYLMVKDVDGMTEEKVVFAPKDQTAWASAWSADGRLLACTVQDSGVKRDVVIVPLDGSPPRRFLTAPYNEMNPTFSPDGNWITYSSDESGRKELYVVSWPDGKGKRQVSTGGEPSLGFWHGDEITYLSADREVTAVRVRVNGSSLDVEKPRALFQVKDAVAFGMSPDASRFAAVFPFEEKGARQADAVELVLNWPAMISNTASRK